MNFKPGDRVMIVNVDDASSHYNGSIGTLEHHCVGCTMRNIIAHGFDSVTWHVMLASGNHVAVAERFMRKIDDGDDSRKIGSWRTCPWKPERLNA